MPLPAGQRAFYEPSTRTVHCPEHAPVHAPGQVGPDLYGGDEGASSARRFARNKAAQRRAEFRARWGPLGPLLLLFAPADAGVRAARKGAAGEDRLRLHLDRLAARSSGRMVALHDRQIPGRRENIDHLVVTTSGIWAVDAKAYAGAVTSSADGAALSVGGRDQGRLLEQSRRQQRFVLTWAQHAGWGAVPVHGVLCFVSSKVTSDAHTGGGYLYGAVGATGHVAVCSPARLTKLLTASGPLPSEQVHAIAAHLNHAFPPA